MALFPVIKEGHDPTGDDTCIERAELLQMVREAQFQDGIGAVIELPTAPNVVTYPKLAYFIWAKTVAGVRTGAFYFYNGTEWLPWTIPDGTLTGAAFQDGSIDLSKLAVPEESATFILRINAAGTEVEAVNVDGVFGNNSIALAKLVAASGEGYILYSGVSGAYEAQLFSTVFDARLALSEINIAALADTDSLAEDQQVLYFPAAGSFASLGFVKDLILDNTLETVKLKLTSLAGRYVKVNATGTDFEAAATPSTKTAKVQATAAAGVDAQVINTAVATVVTLDSETSDPDNIITLTANKIKVLAAGVYEFDINVPLFLASGNLLLQVELYSDTGATVVDYRNARVVEGGDISTASLTALVTAAANAEYSVRIICATAPTNLYLGSPANIGARNEIYTQVIVRKHS